MKLQIADLGPSTHQQIAIDTHSFNRVRRAEIRIGMIPLQTPAPPFPLYSSARMSRGASGFARRITNCHISRPRPTTLFLILKLPPTVPLWHRVTNSRWRRRKKVRGVGFSRTTDGARMRDVKRKKQESQKGEGKRGSRRGHYQIMSQSMGPRRDVCLGTSSLGTEATRESGELKNRGTSHLETR